MKSINFTNRERIEMGEEISLFIEFLRKKLPQADYEKTSTSDSARKARGCD
jgi:hypothetical protein